MRSRRSSKRVDPFYLSKEWEALRWQAFTRDNWRCVQCGTLVTGAKRGGASPHADHIRTRRERPDLALSLANVRTLCQGCHNARTATDNAHAPRRNRAEVDADGYPVEGADACGGLHKN